MPFLHFFTNHRSFRKVTIEVRCGLWYSQSIQDIVCISMVLIWFDCWLVFWDSLRHLFWDLIFILSPSWDLIFAYCPTVALIFNFYLSRDLISTYRPTSYFCISSNYFSTTIICWQSIVDINDSSSYQIINTSMISTIEINENILVTLYPTVWC